MKTSKINRYVLSNAFGQEAAAAELAEFTGTSVNKMLVENYGVRIVVERDPANWRGDPDAGRWNICAYVSGRMEKRIRVLEALVSLQAYRIYHLKTDVKPKSRRRPIDMNAKRTTAKGANVEGPRDAGRITCPAGAEHGPEVPDAQGV